MKKIGIPGWVIDGKCFGVGNSYMEYISKFGKPVIITPQDSEDPPDIDLLFMPGGLDVNPVSYKTVPSYHTQNPNLMLEHFDATLLPYYIDIEVPIFAVCRGAQKIWTHYGGKLCQDNRFHKRSSHQWDQCHDLSFTFDFKYMDKMIADVTSRHHQTIDGSDDEIDAENGRKIKITSIPKELEVIAYSKGKGNTYYPSIVEIFRHREKQIFCVQFHPEDHDDTDKLSPMIISEFLGV